ncbi:MAG: hypothetical protein EA367_06195 [Leptolyngbya sp. DLM2.Bin15]|nr:MAG: hypothetical protein EA367_06195 [Leptolyngbya sp. DLM2.Bin15]
MRRHEKSQRVDIDEYFHGFEDLTEPLATQTSWSPAPTSRSPSVKAILTGNPVPAAPVLAPYQYQSSILSQPKPLNPFELEAAHRAVASIKHQLLGSSDPGVQAQIFPPTPTVAVSQPGSPSPVALVLQKALPLRRSSASQGSHRLWWGSLVAILGTTVTALLVYAYSSNRLPPSLAQVPPLNRLSLVPQRPWSHLSLRLMRLPSPTPAAILRPNPPDEPGAINQAMKFAYTAAELTQSATTEEDWQQVILFWRRAIDELEPIQAKSPFFDQAQERRQTYQDNFDYAQGEREMAPFRLAVNAAETASEMATSARTTEDWAEAAAKWQEALSHMDAVSPQSSRYGVAQAKRAEYATKFAYAQTRYLVSQSRGAL